MATKKKRESVDEKLERADVLAASNSKADIGVVADAIRMVRKLREMGVGGAQYDLRSPYGPTATRSVSEEVWLSRHERRTDQATRRESEQGMVEDRFSPPSGESVL